MKNLIYIITFLIVVACQPSDKQENNASLAEEERPLKQHVEQDTIKGSIPSQKTGSIGNANITINYHSPGVKGRILWGGLVPYDQVWVTGAHMATSLEFDRDLTIGRKKVPAGKYALFTIPGREEWVVIINKNWEQHLADEYDQQEDILRLVVKPSVLNEHQERLQYEIKPVSKDEGAINISWDNLMITVPVKAGR